MIRHSYQAVHNELFNATEAVEALVALRAEARASKDWARADAVRDGMAALGLTIKDTPQGPQVEMA